MYTERDVLNLVGGIYECAAEPSGWDDLLKVLARLAKAQCATMTFHDSVRDQHSISAQTGVAAEAQKAYREHYGALDEWSLGAWRLAQKG